MVARKQKEKKREREREKERGRGTVQSHYTLQEHTHFLGPIS
jgi:hypothetical protein